MSHYTEDKGDDEPKIKFPSAAMAIITQVMEHGIESHPEDDWDEKPEGHHFRKGNNHLAVAGNNYATHLDESGFLTYAHGITRHILELDRLVRASSATP